MVTQIMGIINVTPNSFSGDGTVHLPTIVQQATDFVQAGATLLDIGGESTHPNSPTVDMDTELQRVIPVVTELSRLFPDVVLSIDTYKAPVADHAIKAGATMVNDVWAGLYDGRMYHVVRDCGVPICLMHNSTPWKFSTPPSHDDVYTPYTGQGQYVHHVRDELMKLVNYALEQGVPLDNIIADVGVGFGRTYEQSLCLVGRIGDARPYDCPMVLGASRKGFVGSALSAQSIPPSISPQDRDIGSASCVALGIASGANIVRVHNVAMMAQVVQLADAVIANARV